VVAVLLVVVGPVGPVGPTTTNSILLIDLVERFIDICNFKGLYTSHCSLQAFKWAEIHSKLITDKWGFP
jgi:hypothetical protein